MALSPTATAGQRTEQAWKILTDAATDTKHTQTRLQALTALGDPTGGLLPMFFFPNHDLMVGLGGCLALGLVTGFFPALQAMRLRVAEALRRM